MLSAIAVSFFSSSGPMTVDRLFIFRKTRLTARSRAICTLETLTFTLPKESFARFNCCKFNSGFFIRRLPSLLWKLNSFTTLLQHDAQVIGRSQLNVPQYTSQIQSASAQSKESLTRTGIVCFYVADNKS